MMALEDVISAVAVDEVGIFTARLGPLLLKTAYQPIFSCVRDRLDLAAMCGGVQPLLAGQPIRNALIEAMPPKERLRATDLGWALAILNRVNMDAEGLPLIVSLEETGGSSFIGLPDLFEQLDRQVQGLDAVPGRLICELPRRGDATLEELARHAADCRSRGFDIALAGFSGTAADAETLRALRPELVTLDEAWLDIISTLPHAGRLLPALVKSIRATGCKVHVRGIGDAARLSIATGAGADYLQGDYLALPALAGALLEDKSRPLAAIAGGSGNVVPLFG